MKDAYLIIIFSSSLFIPRFIKAEYLLSYPTTAQKIRQTAEYYAQDHKHYKTFMKEDNIDLWERKGEEWWMISLQRNLQRPVVYGHCVQCASHASFTRSNTFFHGSNGQPQSKANVTGNCEERRSCIYFKPENGTYANVFLKILLATQK